MNKNLIVLFVLCLLLNIIAACAHGQDRPAKARGPKSPIVKVEEDTIKLYDCVSLRNPTGGKTQVCTEASPK